MFGNQRLIGEDVKSWLAKGLLELSQIGNPGVQQIQPLDVPGQMFIPTPGEATAERMNNQDSVSPSQEMDMDKE